jgi:chromate transport protein ChrA
MIRWIRRQREQLVARSIWRPGAVGPQDARLASMLQGYLPRFYVACALFGLLGAYGGIPALRDTFGEDSALALGLLLAVAAICAGAGEAFPDRLWRLEFFAVATLSWLILLYAAAVVIAGLLAGDAGRAAVGAAIYAMRILPQWRVRDVRADREVNGWR